jgi:hypothetical protein
MHLHRILFSLLIPSSAIAAPAPNQASQETKSLRARNAWSIYFYDNPICQSTVNTFGWSAFGTFPCTRGHAASVNFDYGLVDCTARLYSDENCNFRVAQVRPTENPCIRRDIESFDVVCS